MEKEDGVEPRDPEQARRILKEETPRRIRRLRREFWNLYLREHGQHRADDPEEQAA